MKTTAFYFLAFFLFIILGVIGDKIVGRFNDIAEARDIARQFRAEAAFLRFSTNNIVPNVSQIFVDTSAPRDTDDTASVNIRKFRTDSNGIIIGNNRTLPNAKKIIFLGGSTTECNEVSEPFRFPAVVASILRDNGLSIATLNAGVRGHTTQDSINALLNRPGFRDVDVDTVVLMENINDRLRLGTRGNYDAVLGTDGATSGGEVLDAAKTLVVSVWDYLTYRSNSLFLVRYWFNENAAWLDPPQQIEVTKQSIDLFKELSLSRRAKFEENLVVFINVARAMGKRPVLMTQPLGRYSVAQQVFNDSIRKVARNEQALLIDLDQQLGQDSDWAFFSDEIHFNRAGSQAVGKFIATALAPVFGVSIEKIDGHKTMNAQ
jgi:lysophospholipase L1-like esterase